MRANEFILERVTGTIDPRTGDVNMVNQRTGKTTQLRKDTMTTQDDSGTKVYRGGTLRSVSTPKIGGLQATQTFRPDATPGYQKIDYTTGSGVNVSAKGSPETGYTTTVGAKVGGYDIKHTDATAQGGKKTTDLSYQLNPNKTLKAKLTQSQFEDVQNAIREHVKQGIPFTECMFRAGSPAFTEFYRQVREVADKLNLDWQDQELLTTDIGECIMVEGELVPLDVPMEELELDEAEYQGRKVKLNSPKRGGSKKFYVYVKNPKTGRVKKISWGDTTGLSVKAKDRGAVRSFVARHKCKQANDKMTARYWSCRTPRYKALGVKGGQWW